MKHLAIYVLSLPVIFFLSLESASERHESVIRFKFGISGPPVSNLSLPDQDVSGSTSFGGSLLRSRWRSH